MTITTRFAVSIMIFTVSVVGVAAQTPSELNERVQRRAAEFVSAEKGAPPKIGQPLEGLVPPESFQRASILPSNVGDVKMTPATEAEYQAAFREYLGYFKSGFSHRRNVFAWQLLSSQIIFWVVLALVAAGIYFAAAQFQQGLRQSSPTGAEAVTELTASFAGVRVRSPVLGVLILVISFAFFYLYLRFVYPIETTF